jgi:tryptophan-rich sensory protein
MKNWQKLLISIFLCLLAGVVGSIFTDSTMDSWYSTINKPSLVPPNWVFPVVWTTLYILMGIALYLVWSKKPKYQTEKTKIEQSIIVFGLQLVFNVMWTFLFFYLRSPILGLIGIIILWILIMINIIQFSKLSKTATGIMIVYLCWISFATILNIGVLILN